ncbi:MAG: hypothetical protein U0414_31985 [Polyangiaceae bacterium]
MNPFRQFTVAHGAKKDARLGINSTEDRLIAEHGPLRAFDPGKNATHAELAATIADKAKLADLREDIAHEEDALTEHTSPLFYSAGLVLAFAIELLGSMLLMRAVSVEEGERLPLAAALTLAIVGATAVVAHRTSSKVKDGVKESFLKRFAVTLIVLIVYVVLAIAITVVRLEGATDEGGAGLEVIAQAVLMVATAVGPAWAVEWLIRKRAPSVAIRKRLATLKKRLRIGERRQRQAQDEVNRITREAERWQVATARQRALYGVHHKLTTAEENEQ